MKPREARVHHWLKESQRLLSSGKSLICASQTAKVAKSTKVRELVERYEEVKVPSMKFAMYRDQWSAGQKKTAAASMMALIAANPTHKDSNRWMDQLKKLTEKEGEADVP